MRESLSEEERDRFVWSWLSPFEDPVHPSSPVSEEERCAVELWAWAYEIEETLTKIGHTAIYVRQYPKYQSFVTHNISELTYMEYHISSFLHETYGLHERMEELANQVLSMFADKSSSDLKKIKASFLNNYIRKPFKNICKVRGDHAHKRRYTEVSFTRLGFRQMTLDHGVSDEWAEHHLSGLQRFEMRRLKLDWSKRIREVKLKLERLVDSFFDSLYPLIFTPSGKLRKRNPGWKPKLARKD